ncbi:hypothetical protein HOC87_12930 [Candidatus Bathyarchaeota archaeon]|nr:hypothetical protein [Candidatus Bathyarchaeota archaeon]
MSLPSDDIHAYLSSNGLDVIPFKGTDLAYGYRENEPIFAFIVDGGNGSMAFQKAMGMYWATAEYISKPWCLVMVTALPMIPHNRQMLDNLGTQYNIQLLETPQKNALLNIFIDQLENLTSIMHRYLEHTESNPSLSLGESMRTWKSEKPALEDTFHVEIDRGDLSIYDENGKMVPNRTTVPLTVTSGEAEIEGVLLRLVQSEPHLVFYTEHRNLPSVFRLDLKDQILTMRFEADKANIIEATSFESLVSAFKLKNEIRFSDPNSGQTVFNVRVRRNG